MAHIVIAYILWLTGGWVGLHHFYLGRDRQAFVWWATCGGCFGLGWIRDLFRLPEYIFDANNDDRYLRELKHRVIIHPRPPFGTCRFAGEVVVGFIFALITRGQIPDEYAEEWIGWLLSICLPPIASAIGVHLVANIGREKAEIKWPLIGSYIGVFWTLYDSQNVVFSAVIASILVNWKSTQWRKEEREKKHFCKRVGILTLCGCLYLSLWSGAIYFNASITNKDGESIPVREAIPNFFKSPAWNETKETMNLLYQFYKVHGFSGIWEHVVDALDPTGEVHAYRVLGLDDSATQKEITKHYKELAKEWHPDRQKDPSKKEAAHEKFIEIQKAYEILSKIKSEREKKNKRSTYTRDENFKDERQWHRASHDRGDNSNDQTGSRFDDKRQWKKSAHKRGDNSDYHKQSHDGDL